MVKNLLEAGWKMNDILDSPLYYLIEVISEKKKPKPSGSFFDLLG